MSLQERMADFFVDLHPSPCVDMCRHYVGLKKLEDGEIVPTCLAYPKEIPAEFISGERWHTSIEKNQVGEFVFLAKPV